MPQCYVDRHRPAVVNATPWGGKNTNQLAAVRTTTATAYFPWAWASLDGGDNLGHHPALLTVRAARRRADDGRGHVGAGARVQRPHERPDLVHHGRCDREHPAAHADERLDRRRVGGGVTADAHRAAVPLPRRHGRGDRRQHRRFAHAGRRQRRVAAVPAEHRGRQVVGAQRQEVRRRRRSRRCRRPPPAVSTIAPTGGGGRPTSAAIRATRSRHCRISPAETPSGT